MSRMVSFQDIPSSSVKLVFLMAWKPISSIDFIKDLLKCQGTFFLPSRQIEMVEPTLLIWTSVHWCVRLTHTPSSDMDSWTESCDSSFLGTRSKRKACLAYIGPTCTDSFQFRAFNLGRDLKSMKSGSVDHTNKDFHWI